MMVPPDCIGKIIGPKVSNDAYCIVSCMCMSSIHMIYTIYLCIYTSEHIHFIHTLYSYTHTLYLYINSYTLHTLIYRVRRSRLSAKPTMSPQ